MYISSVFVEVDMFYKSVHHFLYQVWSACNARHRSSNNIAAQTYITY